MGGLYSQRQRKGGNTTKDVHGSVPPLHIPLDEGDRNVWCDLKGGGDGAWEGFDTRETPLQVYCKRKTPPERALSTEYLVCVPEDLYPICHPDTLRNLLHLEPKT